MEEESENLFQMMKFQVANVTAAERDVAVHSSSPQGSSSSSSSNKLQNSTIASRHGHPKYGEQLTNASLHTFGGQGATVVTSGSTSKSCVMKVPIESVGELATIAHEMHGGLTHQGLIKDRKYHLKVYKQCFLHQDGLRWLVDRVIKMEADSASSSSSLAGRSFTTMEHYLDELKVKAAKLGNLLIQAGYVSHVCNDHIFDVSHGSRALFFVFHSFPPFDHNNYAGDHDGTHHHHYKTSHLHPTEQVKLETLLAPEALQAARNRGEPSSSFTSSSGVLPKRQLHKSWDTMSVVSVVTTSGNKSMSSSSLYKDDPNRVIDVAVFAIVRDFHSDFRFLKKIKDRTFHLKIYKKCFLHHDGMEWLSRQVRIHYHARAAREQNLIKKQQQQHNNKTKGSNRKEYPVQRRCNHPLPFSLTHQQSEEIGARIGNLMIDMGYVTHVCGDHTFYPNVGDSMNLFFKFRDKLIDADADTSGFGRYGEMELDDMQQKFFEREIDKFFQDHPPRPPVAAAC